MSSAFVIFIIISMLVILITYAFVSQTLEKKRKQKQRLLAALKLRSKDFKYMISGFPDGFLSKDLSVLVHRCLLEVTEQLSKLEPNDTIHLDELTLISQQLEDVKRKPKNNKRVQLDNPQQVKEVKTLLQGLNTFIANQQQRGNISTAQYKLFESQIKQLAVQITVDAYIVNAKQAQGSDKARLAIHYYTLAKKILARETGGQDYRKQILHLNDLILKLEQEQTEAEPEYGSNQRAEAAKLEASEAWDKFDDKKEDNPWKKKSIYD